MYGCDINGPLLLGDELPILTLWIPMVSISASLWAKMPKIQIAGEKC